MSDHRRVYGSEPDEAPGPQPGRTYAELLGGPLDGQLLDITGWTTADIADGATLITDGRRVLCIGYAPSAFTGAGLG